MPCPTQTLARVKTPASTCVWSFGDGIAGTTTRDFGKEARYGTPDVARYGTPDVARYRCT